MKYNRADASMEAVRFLDDTESVLELTEFLGEGFSVDYADPKNPVAKFKISEEETIEVRAGDYFVKVPYKGKTVLMPAENLLIEDLINSGEMIAEGNDVRRINIVKLASELANDKLKDHYAAMGMTENAYIVSDEEGNTSYTETAQKTFDKFYDGYYELIENCKEV